MSVTYNFSKGIDVPVWTWINPFMSGPSYHGVGNAYDGSRYIYWCIQWGTTATSASTTQLWRYCTWTHGWQFLATTISGNRGVDVEFDAVRNVVYMTSGAALTSWQVFNLNTATVNICGIACPAYTLTTLTPVLPAAADYGASLTMPEDLDIPAQIDVGAATAGSTTTVLVDNAGDPSFGPGMIGLQVRFTSGLLSGQKFIITAYTSQTTLTFAPTAASAPVVGDGYVIEMPEDISNAAGTTTTLTDSTAAWPVNIYANSDVIITGGTGVGQRRRIASNTATVLTLAAAQAGNARTGVFTTVPDATSTYKIVPSSDFMYYQPGVTSAGFYKIDLATGLTAPTWTTLTNVTGTPGGGGNTFFAQAYAPFSVLCFRGNGTSNMYQYSCGTNTWSTPFASWVGLGAETFAAGSTAVMLTGKRRMMVFKDGQVRSYVFNLTNGVVEGSPTLPYSNPGSYDGHRGRFVKSADGAEFLYLLRPGGQEFFRLPVEWL